MNRTKVVIGVLAVMAATTFAVAVVRGQEGGQGGEGRRQFDPAQMRQAMTDRMREALGATEEEWAIIGPRLEKVQTLSRETRGGMFGAFRTRGGRGGQRGGEEQAAEQEQTEMQKATAALQAALDNEASTAAQIRTSLTAYRKAREKVRQDLAKAQEELRAVLSIRQEAQLVMMGTLD